MSNIVSKNNIAAALAALAILGAYRWMTGNNLGM